MSARAEIPFPPRPSEPSPAHVEPPLVPFEPRWEYKELVRDLKTEGLPSEAELNAFGKDHWERPADLEHRCIAPMREPLGRRTERRALRLF
jgi:hypothetical protein